MTMQLPVKIAQLVELPLAIALRMTSKPSPPFC